MLTQIQCLDEIETSIPESPRRFHVENELMGIDPAKVILARTFTGIFMFPVAGQELETRTEQTLMDIWLEGGIKVTTMFNDELKELLFGKIAGGMAESMGGII